MESERSNGNLDLVTGESRTIKKRIKNKRNRQMNWIIKGSIRRKRAAYVSTCCFGNQLLIFTFILRAFSPSVSQCCNYVAAQAMHGDRNVG